MTVLLLGAWLLMSQFLGAMHLSTYMRTIKCPWPHCTSTVTCIEYKHHIKAHERCESKIFQCPFGPCSAYFYQKKHLMAHINTKHAIRKLLTLTPGILTQEVEEDREAACILAALRDHQ